MDMIIGTETEFLKLFLFLLKAIFKDIPRFIHVSTNFPSHCPNSLSNDNLILKKVNHLFISVRKKLATLANQDKLGFNVNPLLRLLDKAIQSLE